MKRPQLSFIRHSTLAIALLWAPGDLSAKAATNELGRLTFEGAVTAEELRGAVDLAISTNGQFLYAAAFHVNTIGVYQRDPDSGQLSPVQFVRKLPGLSGLISIRLSPDERYAVAAAFQSRSVVLFKRDPATGELEQAQIVRGQDGVDGLGFPVRARFSPNGKHVYALDGRSGGITAFGFSAANGLEWLQTLTNNSTARGSRALAVLPDGRTIVAVNFRSHALTVFDRDVGTGRLSLRQAVLDGEDGADQIEGQFGVTATPDGKFVYVCSGRFGGDNAVSAFAVTKQRGLTPVQAFVEGEDGLVFAGGNEVIVTPDGQNVYATATRSGTLACFARDAQSGKLRLIQSFLDDKRTVRLAGPAGLERSPDGRFVYVALEAGRGIAIYRRAGAAGAK